MYTYVNRTWKNIELLKAIKHCPTSFRKEVIRFLVSGLPLLCSMCRPVCYCCSGCFCSELSLVLSLGESILILKLVPLKPEIHLNNG
jgi:hypothetical protein